MANDLSLSGKPVDTLGKDSPSRHKVWPLLEGWTLAVKES